MNNLKRSLLVFVLVLVVTAASSYAGTIWYDAKDLGLEGKGWANTDGTYARLPAYAQGQVTPTVWYLAHNSAGLSIHFYTDAPSITVRWTLTSSGLAMPHMPATGVSGVDLYVRQPSGWRWVATGQPTEFPSNTATMLGGVQGGPYEYRLYLPLYNGVSKVEIGIPADYEITAAPDYLTNDRKPIVMYGTSITQGACTSRTGRAVTSQITRKLNIPVVNLGFSGSGKMEPEMANLISEVDASVYVLDCLANLNEQLLSERLEPFITILRSHHPQTPIVLVEHPNFPLSEVSIFPYNGQKLLIDGMNNVLEETYDKLVAGGDENLYYITGSKMYGTDGEGSVDGVHPNDLGIDRRATIFVESLRKIVNKPYDLDMSGVVSSSDVAVLGQNWLAVDPNPVRNYSFELDKVDAGNKANLLPQSWTWGWGDLELCNLDENGFAADYSAETFGQVDQFVRLTNAAGLVQNLDLKIMSDTKYFLLFDLGTPASDSDSWLNVKLTAIDDSGCEKTILKKYYYESNAGGNPDLVQSQWQQAEIFWDSKTDTECVGSRLCVQFRGNVVDIDNVRVVVCDNTGDINSDCSVDLGDYSILANHWLETIQ